MKHLTLVILLALAPLSWGEEESVFYCEREAAYTGAYNSTIEPVGWDELTKTFELNERIRFLVKVNSHEIEFADHPRALFKNDFITNRFDRFDSSADGSKIIVEGAEVSSQAWKFRLSGFEEKGSFPYMLLRAGFERFPFLEYEAGTCTKL